MENKYISILIVIIGLIISIYGAVLCMMSNFNLGVMLVVVLGIFLTVIGVFYKYLKRHTKTGFLKYCKIFVIFVLCIELVLVSFIAIYGVVDSVDYNEDAVIVLGAGVRGDKVTLPLKYRLDEAVRYHAKNPEALIVVSGGKGFQETVTEAYAMEKYLIQSGVNKNKIIKEEMATSTEENMMYSKEILDNYFEKEYSVVVITNNFHIYRSVMLAEKSDLKNISHLHATLQWYNLMPCYLRESLAVLKMFVLD